MFREKGPDLLNIIKKFSLSSITTPMFLAVFEGVISPYTLIGFDIVLLFVSHGVKFLLLQITC